MEGVTDSQISLPVPTPPPLAPGAGRHHTRAGGTSQPGAQEEVSGLRLGEGKGPEPLTFTVPGMRPVGQGSIRHGQTGMAYHANGKILKPWRALIQAAAVDLTGRHAYVAPKPIKVKGEKTKRPPEICVACGTLRKHHGLYLGAVGLFAVVTFAKPKGDPGRRFPITRNIGDYDHHARAIGDALTGVIWADDAQVVDGRTVKTYIGEHPDALSVPGAAVWIWEIA